MTAPRTPSALAAAAEGAAAATVSLPLPGASPPPSTSRSYSSLTSTASVTMESNACLSSSFRPPSTTPAPAVGPRAVPSLRYTSGSHFTPQDSSTSGGATREFLADSDGQKGRGEGRGEGGGESGGGMHKGERGDGGANGQGEDHARLAGNHGRRSPLASPPHEAPSMPAYGHLSPSPYPSAPPSLDPYQQVLLGHADAYTALPPAQVHAGAGLFPPSQGTNSSPVGRGGASPAGARYPDVGRGTGGTGGKAGAESDGGGGEGMRTGKATQPPSMLPSFSSSSFSSSFSSSPSSSSFSSSFSSASSALPSARRGPGGTKASIGMGRSPSSSTVMAVPSLSPQLDGLHLQDPACPPPGPPALSSAPPPASDPEGAAFFQQEAGLMDLEARGGPGGDREGEDGASLSPQALQGEPAAHHQQQEYLYKQQLSTLAQLQQQEVMHATLE
ncbi:hypothetical protein NSK_007411 [Nannochloropsis salina CCMP1776]|uniref:Uncharacterized protein n=1 Tax=Nannochloropsis salina CCMP1776 TaxID=1027361 RepID=A0A4D9CQR0_9STRA|nr:hypothetical protein NSK_007411 [Nannochloropsis salina CCMP1776]|eukprot:TFJ81450.1 hypothetical protein NSK_007411 [Nannochloropsis salina CCMP1776]